MVKTLRAQFDGEVLVPQGAVDLPLGRVLELRVQESLEQENKQYSQSPKTLNDFVDWAESLPPLTNSPGDGSKQHDHYLYGTPKLKPS